MPRPTLRSRENTRLAAAAATLADGQAPPAERTEALRSVLRLQEEVAARVPPVQAEPHDDGLTQLAELAARALRELGGCADPPTWSLRDYDAERLGPIFAVSDDGDAAPAIVQAFLDSPKAGALRRRGLLSLETIGACVDAERMSAAGELLVGVDEYAKVRAAAAGRVPMTTNVGTVVLPRFYRPLPYVTYEARGVDDPPAAALAELREAFAPFLSPPGGGPPRPITVYVAFRGADRLSGNAKVDVLRTLAAAAASEGFADPKAHRLGLLQRADGRSSRAPKLAIDLAARAGLADVMIEADARFESQDQLLFPGLLSFFDARRVNTILAHARERGVNVVPKNRIDVSTAARTIWAGLTAARGMGAQLGKFGLHPLMLEQHLATMELVLAWFPAWTAAPAFYVDRPLVAADRITSERELVEPLTRWLGGAARAGASMVLIDSPDRTPIPAGTGELAYHADRGRRTLKRSDTDALGVLTLADVDVLEQAARRQRPRLRILWSGGIDGRQALALARRKAFGIFTTSTTARQVAVGGTGGDPALASEMEPTYRGVLGVRMVIEAGFLSSVAADAGDRRLEKRLLDAAEPVLVALEERRLTTDGDAEGGRALDHLRAVLEPAWDAHLAGLVEL